MQNGIGSGSIVSGKHAGLQFSDPIPTLGLRQGRITCQIALEPELIKLIIIEGSKLRGQAAKGPNEAELRSDVVDDATESHPFYKLETTLRCTLHLHQRISRQ